MMFTTSDSGTVRHCVKKKTSKQKNLVLNLNRYIKFNSKWIVDLHIKYTT